MYIFSLNCNFSVSSTPFRKTIVLVRNKIYRFLYNAYWKMYYMCSGGFKLYIYIFLSKYLHKFLVKKCKKHGNSRKRRSAFQTHRKRDWGRIRRAPDTKLGPSCRSPRRCRWCNRRQPRSPSSWISRRRARSSDRLAWPPLRSRCLPPSSWPPIFPRPGSADRTERSRLSRRC